jgi:hypothetical protein
MSETTETAPQGGADPAEPAVIDPNAPGTEGAATEPTPEQVEAEKAERESRAERRIGRLTARLSAGEAERARMAAELDAMRRAITQPPPEPQAIPQTPEELERLVEARADAKAAQAAAKAAHEANLARVQTFHKAGQAAFTDWNERCQNLMEMGADPAFAELLVEIPDGAKVAAALSDDPEEMERIAALKSERWRAIALGRYAATLEAKPAPELRTSRAPAPIAPIAARGTRVAFNEYRETDADALVDYYRKQQQERRRAH